MEQEAQPLADNLLLTMEVTKSTFINSKGLETSQTPGTKAMCHTMAWRGLSSHTAKGHRHVRGSSCSIG